MLMNSSQTWYARQSSPALSVTSMQSWQGNLPLQNLFKAMTWEEVVCWYYEKKNALQHKDSSKASVYGLKEINSSASFNSKETPETSLPWPWLHTGRKWKARLRQSFWFVKRNRPARLSTLRLDARKDTSTQCGFRNRSTCVWEGSPP